MGLLVLLNIIAVLATHAASEGCPQLYQRYSSSHTYCKPPNPQCTILRTLISDGDIQVILREHNMYRDKVAAGKERKLPTAANMLQMVWDKELAAVAQQHANQCLFEHDCSSCRRVQNYGVGQNLAIEEIRNGGNVPSPNWPSAIKNWYDEVTYFAKELIDPFVAPPSDPTYGHFSQVVWAESWRVGCGYVLHIEPGNVYKKLYVCNYGPGGNTIQKSMYKVGKPCSACPENSCCGTTCGNKNAFSTLCQITDNKVPTYTPQGTYIFYCDFKNQPDCDAYFTGTNNWLIYNTLSGNYIGIILKGGEESTMVFTKRLKPSISSFCFVTNYRKGPNKAGQLEANRATETFTIVEQNYEVKQDLASFGKDQQQQFSQFSMALGWDMETEVKITFSVPAGQPEQFFEIRSVYATEGSCAS